MSPQSRSTALFLGDLSYDTDLERAIYRSVREPDTCASELPYLLRVSSIDICDQVSTAAEVAYIRWGVVAEALEELGFSTALADRLATALKAADTIAIIFDERAAAFRKVVEAIGNDAAFTLSNSLRGAAFVLPCMEWDKDIAIAIEADCRAQRVSSERKGDDAGWAPGSERLALEAAAAKWARKIAARLPK